MRIFDPDGPLMTAMSKFADIVICNILFCLFCLPIFTIGASLAALFSCMQALVYEEDRNDGLIFKAFWAAFRQNFKKATVLWLICLALLLFLGAYYWIAQHLAGAFGTVYQITFYCLLLVFLFGFLYVFPLQARFENTVRNTLRNAWLLSIAAFPWTLLSLLLIAAAFYISFIMNPRVIDVFVYLWAVCGFALTAYLLSFLIRQAFRKISPEKLEQKTPPAEGAIFTDEEHREHDLMTAESSYSDPDWNRRDFDHRSAGKKQKRR